MNTEQIFIDFNFPKNREQAINKLYDISKENKSNLKIFSINNNRLLLTNWTIKLLIEMYFSLFFLFILEIYFLLNNIPIEFKFFVTIPFIVGILFHYKKYSGTKELQIDLKNEIFIIKHKDILTKLIAKPTKIDFSSIKNITHKKIIMGNDKMSLIRIIAENNNGNHTLIDIKSFSDIKLIIHCFETIINIK